MFRVLSIDGGGIKGIFPAAFLCAVQESLAAPIASHFDLIAGTSTGGIIALGLGLGLSPREILEFYRSNARQIFPESQRWITRFKHHFFTKYKSDPLRSAFGLAFGEKLLGHSERRLIIPSFSAQTGKIYIYKTPHHERFASDWKIPAVEVAMATAAAPSYFPPFVSSNHIAHLDGGMWANNPTGNAVVEAIGILGVDPKEIRVLSIGCTSTRQSFALKNAGMWGWRRKALDAVLSGQSFGSMGIATTLIGHTNILRIDPTVPEGRYTIDNIRMIDELEGLARESARDELPNLKAMFDQGQARRFEPFYGPLK